MQKQALEQQYESLSRQASKMQYADLTLRINRRVPPNCYQPVPVQRPQLLPMSTLPRRLPSSSSSLTEPTIYAQVAKPIYIPPPHQYMGAGGRCSADDSTAETPLIGCDNKVRRAQRLGIWVIVEIFSEM